jgi:cation:H+ antiporter
MTWLWLQFIVLGALIAGAGYHLCRTGDQIAHATGMTGGWVGLALLASVTSLPELVIGITSVTGANVPNIAVGDALGSCVINLGFLVVLDFLYRKEALYERASQAHVLSAGFGIVLIALVGLNIVMSAGAPARAPMVANLTVGLYTPLILLLYPIALRTLYIHEARQAPAAIDAMRAPVSLASAARHFALAALVVMLAGIRLPFVGSALADAMGWNQSFVGTLFVAAITSLPELAVTVSALRIGALDMAIGNLLGSNLFNVAIIAIDDIFYVKGPLLAHVSAVHASTVFSAVIMSGLAVVGLLYRPRSRVLRTVGWVSVAMLLVYVFNAYITFLHGA